MHLYTIITYTNTQTYTYVNSHTPAMAMGPKRKPQTTRTHNSGKNTQTLLLSHSSMCDAFELANKIQISRFKSIGAHFVYLTCHIHTKGRWKSHLIDKKVTFSTTSECEPLSEWIVCFFDQNSASQKKSPCFYLHFQSIHRTDSNKNNWKVYNAIFWNSNQLYNSVTLYFVSIFKHIRYMHSTIYIWNCSDGLSGIQCFSHFLK